MSKILSNTLKGYAVRMPSSGLLASGKDGMPAIFPRIKKAHDFRKERIPHIGNGRVVRVTVEIREG